MTGFEPRTSGIGSDRSTNWATTTSQHILKMLYSANFNYITIKGKTSTYIQTALTMTLEVGTVSRWDTVPICSISWSKSKNFFLGSYLQPNCFIHDHGSRYILKMWYSAHLYYITIEGKTSTYIQTALPMTMLVVHSQDWTHCPFVLYHDWRKNFYLQPNCFTHDRGSRYILKMRYSTHFYYITIEGKTST